MRNVLALSVLLAGCTETPEVQKPEPVQVDNGITSPSKAADLVKRWEKEGFDPLTGMFEPAIGAAVLWDPNKCDSTSTDYANGVAINAMEPVSGDINGLHIEVTQPVNPSLKIVQITPMRVCDDGLKLFKDSQSMVRNAEPEKGIYSVLSGYHNILLAKSAITELEKITNELERTMNEIEKK